MVVGPVPWDAPDVVATLMPVVRSNPGNSSWYARAKPPDIITLTSARPSRGNARSAARPIARPMSQRVRMDPSPPEKLPSPHRYLRAAYSGCSFRSCTTFL